jgi:tetratricopeptide (TPR) repeat protein
VATTTELDETFARAERLCDAGDYASALDLLDDLVRRAPDDARFHTTRAWALENLGPECLAEARDAYREAIRADPSALWAKEGLSNVLRRLGETKEAEALCREVVAEARSRVAEARTRGERDADLLELLGWCEYRLGLLEDAEATFRGALDIDEGLVAVRFDLALTLLCAGDHAGALIEYLDGVRRAMEHPELVRGLIGVAMDDLDEALIERPELSALPETCRARDLLRSALA